MDSKCPIVFEKDTLETRAMRAVLNWRSIGWRSIKVPWRNLTFRETCKKRLPYWEPTKWKNLPKGRAEAYFSWYYNSSYTRTKTTLISEVQLIWTRWKSTEEAGSGDKKWVLKLTENWQIYFNFTERKPIGVKPLSIMPQTDKTKQFLSL